MFPGKVSTDTATVEAGLPSLLAAMATAGCTTPRRQAAFLATVAHESRFLYNIPGQGDTRPYKGRGFIQLTGEPNYRDAGTALGVDLVGNPELALSLDWSAKVAAWYWTKARPKCNEYADALDMSKIAAAIGYPVGDATEDKRRCDSFKSALAYLTGEPLPAGIVCSRPIPPPPPPVVPPPAPAWSSSERLGQWAVDGYLVNNNIWNQAEAGTQTITATSPGSWVVVADHSRPDVRPGSIKSYPDTQKNFTDRAIDSFTEITAAFDMTCPPVGEWNSAFDIWINGIGSKCTHEIMVWVDHRYNGVLPPKNATEATTVTIDGQGYTAWRRPLNPGDTRSYIALAMNPMKAAGTVDLLKVFKELVRLGWLKGTDKVAAIEYGVEIASTAGGPQTYRLNQYTLTAR
jgi:predicted chitinase